MANTPEPPSQPELRRLRSRLLRWYLKNRRDLPWRRSRDPYNIWVSEIMLQQTRVNAVLGYYERFIDRFPTVHALAMAEEREVLAAWSGLGYYRRARAMHQCARTLVAEHSGILPRLPSELRQLPGIGEYTSAAIASIGYGHASAVVDGNVERVLSRIFALRSASQKTLRSLALALLDERRAGDWNQAMMELGATVCTPANPQCPACPLRAFCRLPGAATNTAKQGRRKASVTYALFRRGGRVRLVQRSASASLMPSMCELPRVVDENAGRVIARHKHSITVTDYDVTVVSLPRMPQDGVWVEESRLGALPLTGLARKVLRDVGLLTPATSSGKPSNESKGSKRKRRAYARD